MNKKLMKDKSKISTIMFLITTILIIGLFFSIDARAQAYDLDWTTTEVVSTESTGISGEPSLGVESDGTVHIAWWDDTGYGGSGTDYDIFYKKYVPGSGWTTTQVVSTESTDISTRPSLGVESDGNVHIAWEDLTDYGGSGTDRDIFYKRYIPGSGWTSTVVVSTESTDNSYEPSLGVESDGTVHIAWEDYTDYSVSGTDCDIFYKKYVPGSGWTTTQVVSTESTDNSYSPSLDVGSNGNVHIAWEDLTDYGIAGTDRDIFYKYYVAGSIWGTTEVVSTESTDDSYNPSVGSGSGAVHIAWEDLTYYGGSGTDRDIFYKRRRSGSWGTTRVVSTEGTGGSYAPSLDVGSDGTIHIAWCDLTDYGDSGTDWDVFYKKYVQDTGWNTEVVSTESTSSSIIPSLGVGSDGTVHIAWWDTTDYGGSGTDDDVFYKRTRAPTVTKTVDPYYVYVPGYGDPDNGKPEWFEVKLEVTGFGENPSTAPTNLDVTEVTMPYIIDESSFSITPDSISEDVYTGCTIIEWYDIGDMAGVGDGVDPLTSSETFTVTFMAKCDKFGSSTVDTLAPAPGLLLTMPPPRVDYIDPNGEDEVVYIPQAYVWADLDVTLAKTVNPTEVFVGEWFEVKLEVTGFEYQGVSPYPVWVYEYLPPYITVDESSFSITPDYFAEQPDGTTAIHWLNIENKAGVGDGLDPLNDTETFTVTFMAKCTQAGNNLPVDADYSEAIWSYYGDLADAEITYFPQAYIDVEPFTRDALWNRLVEIILAWPTSTPTQRAELWEDVVEIILLWPTAP